MTSSTLLLVVNILASTSALYMCFSPAPAIYRVHTDRHTGHLPALPLVAQWTYNHIWMLYGYQTDAIFPLCTTYAVGSALSVLFLSIYYFWANERRYQVLQLMMVGCMFNIATTLYTFFGPDFQNPHDVGQMIGFIAIGCGLVLYASPFATISTVVRTKSAISIPIGMVAVGTISNAIWIVYGVLVDDWILTSPTVVNTVLCLVQLMLYVIYCPTRSLKGDFMESDDASNNSTGPESMGSEKELSYIHLETPRHDDSLRVSVSLAVHS